LTSTTAATTITSAATVIQSSSIEAFSNYILLNSAETGAGVTPGFGGIGIYRGPSSTTYQLVYDDIDQTLKAGFSTTANRGPLNIVGTVSQSQTSGILAWDATTHIFSDPTPTTDLGIRDLVLTGTLTANGETMTFPPNGGAPNYILSTDGSGNLSWVANTAPISGTATKIISTDTKTSVDTQATPNTITIIVNGTNVATTTKDESIVNNMLVVGGGLTLLATSVATTNYIADANDNFIKWNGVAAGTLTIPLANVEGRVFIIYNMSVYPLTVSSADLIDGHTNTIILPHRYDHVKLLADGVSNWIVI
jgi:hypothetical protein